MPLSADANRIAVIHRSRLTESQILHMTAFAQAPEHKDDPGGIKDWGAPGYAQNQFVAVDLSNEIPFALAYVGPSGAIENLGLWEEPQHRGRRLMNQVIDRLAEVLTRERPGWRLGRNTIQAVGDGHRKAVERLLLRLEARLHELSRP